ncbi:dienelactone hydrolase [Bradyrhizobium sp. R2.2-H]|jgi:dienelactone hydrolase|uniref:alpha/beta hydrolase family protein n=1 Tax=unclassified Bradyrhizobium TaxID=2631580 RepID=UPI001045998F|nr:MULTISPECIES: alpha/beta hydrolase [unclassified Bradyrhizobium]TCU76898.1 dienelactone hydrolase [Bradyrhizobium sp. Y-H1]TCU79971.1 dienelactone hydrolase [Bradyrhizobium sp. R2.2-H]
MIPACLSDDWTLCPEREDISAEFTRLLTAAQEGGATIAECLMIARQLKRGDDRSWHREWKKLAQTNRQRAEAAFAEGHRASAQRNWLRAMNYYGAAAMPLDLADERRWVAVLAMQDCARRYLAARSPAGEVVTIPWLDGHSLQGYFLPSPSAGGRAPTVICIGEPGHRKEEFLIKLVPHARERGFSMLAIDLFGDQRDDFLDALLRRRDLESAIPGVMDYLETRGDVDFARVGIIADGWGSSFVSRAVLQEPRLAAAVCDGGLWDLHERAFFASRFAMSDVSIVPVPHAPLMASSAECPVLITLGEDGWLKADRARQIVRNSRLGGSDVMLKVFTAAETGAAQGHADNPSLANEYIFDWLESRLGAAARI